jgi:ATP-dependent exoDNAse (exonuclease V) beta subunit
MSLPVKKIISASAGTGKTYRLSLEYLALLLKFHLEPDFRPDQILVITFTRKATAEIRDRIYSHLDSIINRKKEWQILASNLKHLTDKDAEISRDNPLSEAELKVLSDAYHRLMTHKDELQVMTIDSYVHSIFRNLIRPVRGIDRFELDLKAVEKRIPFLFDELMTPELLSRISGLLSRRLKPSLDEFRAFFRSLIDNRWLFYLTTKRSVNAAEGSLAYFTVHPEKWDEIADEYYSGFVSKFQDVIYNLSEFIKTEKNLTETNEIIAGSLLNKDYVKIFTPMPVRLEDLAYELKSYLKDDYTLEQILKLLEGEKYLWNGSKIRASKANPFIDDWKKLSGRAMEDLANYLLYHLFLPEQQEIINIWECVLDKYDKLIYRYKNFTYDDIAWFTFEALYSSQPPLFEAEPESVANEFYEFMCHRTRFMLIDEFQDTSTLQFHILRPMIDELLSGAGSFPYGGLIVVGDEKQSIFGWRGGQRDLLLNLDNIFQSGLPAEREALTESWRSSPTFMNCINGIFNHNVLQDFLHKADAEWNYADTSGNKHELEQETLFRFKLANYSSHSDDNKAGHTMRNFVDSMIVPAVTLAANSGRKTAVLARRNEELEMIRALLAERGITAEFQSAKSLLEHPVIKAVSYLLKFAVYHDWYDFLAFLRSDLMLMKGAELKQVMEIISAGRSDRTETNAGISFDGLPSARAAYELAASINVNEIYKSILTILQTCNIRERKLQERDYINLQYWLDKALEFERGYQSGLPELMGFLRYCEDNRDQEIMQQRDVESSNAIQLLTIHKSKGLEFDSVFVWWNLRSTPHKEETRLSSWVHYTDKSYHNLSDIALTLHYKKVLQNSVYRDIMLEEEKRELLEELNNLYVALTRARNRLYLYVAFDKKEGWDKYWEVQDKEGRLTPPHYAVKSALLYMTEHGVQQPDGFLQLGIEPDAGQSAAEDSIEPEPVSDTQDFCLSEILPDWQNPFAASKKRDDYNPEMNWKTSYLTDRSNLKGNIAHYYLSLLKYATREEMEQAKTLTLRRFGNLMTGKDLQELIARLEAILPSIKDIFNEKYDLVLNEYPVFHGGREYRMDRLMIDTKARTYRIIDYKTGGVYDELQLQRYNAILKEKLLPEEYVPEQEFKPTEIRL